MRKQTKIAAVVSAAALLAIGASMTSFAATGWQEENGTWVYYDRTESMVTGDWAKSGDNWFYLGDNGEMVRDAIVESNDNTYYVDANGAMVTNRWVEVENADASGDDASATVWYYFQANGKAYKAPTSGKTSFKTINGKKYAFDVDGKMLYGWVDEQSTRQVGDEAWVGGTYYLGDANDGAQVTGAWKQLGVVDNTAEDPDQNYWFYFQNNGKKYKGTEKSINGKKYRFDANGKMVSEWNEVSTASTATVSNYAYFSDPDDGAKKVRGWFKVVPSENLNKDANENDSAKWYYADAKGRLYSDSIKTINGKKYLFNAAGEMVTGLRYLTFDAAGKVTSSEEIDSEAKVKDYASVEATHATNGKTGVYYFVDNGDMQSGNQTVSVDGDSYTFKFKTSGSSKGVGLNGKDKDAYYRNGRKIQADNDLVYGVYEVNADGVVTRELKSENLVNRSYMKYKGQSKETTVAMPGKELNYTGSVEHYNNTGIAGKVVVLNTTGTIISNGTRKDGNDVRLVTKGGYLRGAYINE